MLVHSQTTPALISSLNQLKESKKQITDRLLSSISSNNDIYDHHSLSSRKYNMRLIVNREKAIEVLHKKLTHKIENENNNSIKLASAQHETLKKRLEIEKKLQEINSRNHQRIQQLREIEQKMIRKIEEEFERKEAKEKQLRAEYVRIKNESSRASEIKVLQKKESYQQWKLLQSEKWRLEAMVKEHEEKQNVLVTHKNPIAVRKEERKKSDEKYIPTEKEYNKLKPKHVDAKEMGKQYLQQAKLMHREQMTKKNKKKLMNLNLKFIGYGADIMDKIYRNTSDLSNFPKQKEEKAAEEPFKLPIVAVKEEKKESAVKFQFKLSDDLETERYLKQIKSSLHQLEILNNEQTNPETVQAQQSLLMPSTLSQ